MTEIVIVYAETASFLPMRYFTSKSQVWTHPYGREIYERGDGVTLSRARRYAPLNLFKKWWIIATMWFGYDDDPTNDQHSNKSLASG